MVFKNLRSPKGVKKNSIFLGSPEAEAEALANSQMSLHEAYEDYHDLFTEFTHEKFILVGRKGSGKSAFAEYVTLLSNSEPNLFCKFIRHGDANLEKIVQIGKENGHEIENENLFKWLIYTHLLKLFSENCALSTNKDYELLLKFLRKNSGFVNIKENELKEQIKKEGFDINLEYFKRFFRARHNRQLEIKESKAPFYKLLPHLEEVLIKTLSSKEECENKNAYILFFDDLDIGFSASDRKSIDSLINLLRIAKYVNNEIFGKHGIKSKVIILIRDDISKLLSSTAADTAKIFSSYSSKINWFPTDLSRDQTWDIRKFINKRICISFSKNNIPFNEQDPWQDLIDESCHPASSFRHILNFTLYRPRDLLLFFQPLQSGNFDLPLKDDDIFSLVGQYSENLALEIKNELSSFYSQIQIETIFNALNEINKNEDCTYSDACKIFDEYCQDLPIENLLEDLFNRSIIGNFHEKGVRFKFREPINAAESYKLKKEHKIIIQNSFKVYFSNKYA